MKIDFHWFWSYTPLLLKGLVTTLELLLLSGFLGLLLAIVVAFARLSSSAPLAYGSSAFCTLIRGTPLLVQIYLFYYGLGSVLGSFPSLQESWMWPYLREGFWYIVFALTLSVGAYVGEVIRGGLKAVPRGELEAARALGMHRWLLIRRIWLPRALRMLLPTLAGESVMLLKSTALASTVAVMDVLGAANKIRSETFRTYEPLLIVALVYFVLAVVIERSFAKLEKGVQVRRANSSMADG